MKQQQLARMILMLMAAGVITPRLVAQTAPSSLPTQTQSPPKASPPSMTPSQTREATSGSAESGSLTEGLLELLSEPNRSAETLRPSTAESPASKSDSANTRLPQDARGLGSERSQSPASSAPGSLVPELDGEDLGQAAEGPLVAIFRRMSEAADRLRAREDLAATRESQMAAVTELDRLIEQLEQAQQDAADQAASQGGASSEENASNSADSSNAEQPPPQASPQRDRSRSGASQRAESAEQVDPANEPDPASSPALSMRPEAGATPGNSLPGNEQGQAASDSDSKPNESGQNLLPGGTNRPGQRAGQSSKTAAPTMSDPRKLQQSAWGNLPERRREQMQSRMVEQFLPAYRREIEAYYRALAAESDARGSRQ